MSGTDSATVAPVSDVERKRAIIRDVMEAVMSGDRRNVAGYFAPGALFVNRNNAGTVDVSWFDRMEGDFRLASETEARAFLEEVMRRATFISYEDRGLIVEEDEGAGRYNWTRRDERSGSILTGTTVYWFSFTSDFRIRSVETIGYIHSVLPVRGSAAA